MGVVLLNMSVIYAFNHDMIDGLWVLAVYTFGLVTTFQLVCMPFKAATHP